MAGVAVVDAEQVEPRGESPAGVVVRQTLGTQTGFGALEQAVLELAPGSSESFDAGVAEQTMFVVAGTGVATLTPGEQHELGPDVGLYLPPGSQFTLHNSGAATLRVVAVRVPEPD